MAEDPKTVSAIEGTEIYRWCVDLFPICRSITGKGVRQTLEYYKGIVPELSLLSLPTGTEVFDWAIPQEWIVRDAFIEHDSGQRFAEFKKTNLHVLNYSAPLDKSVGKAELADYIWVQDDQPDRIPYVTSYYDRRSGFCLSRKEYESLPSGSYHLYIDSEHVDGQLDMAELIIEGRSKQEILISSYVCHPSMANNELSGPSLAIGLAKYIKSLGGDHHYTYRFVLVPETIGALAYLSLRLEDMQAATVAGFVLSCVGDDGDYSSVASRSGETLADQALFASLRSRERHKQYSFLHRGSDERQYCAPGVDLPVACFCRTKFGEFPEYHTDADDLDFISPGGLQGAFDVMREIIEAFEAGLYPKTTTIGEPQFGRRGLRSTIGKKEAYFEGIYKLCSDVVAYADGKTSIFEMSRIFGVDLAKTTSCVRLLKQNDLLV